MCLLVLAGMRECHVSARTNTRAKDLRAMTALVALMALSLGLTHDARQTFQEAGLRASAARRDHAAFSAVRAALKAPLFCTPFAAASGSGLA